MKSKSIPRPLFTVVALVPFAAGTLMAQTASVWLTAPDRSSLVTKQPNGLQFSHPKKDVPTIAVDDAKKFQTIDGFGFALTGGSAQLLMHMSAPARASLLKQLFSTDGDGIGVSYLRVSIGSSDMNANVYSYDDLPEGETDPTLAKFSLAHDEVDVIPALKEILAINPKIKILGSPWSAPTWMKTNDNFKGGTLKPEYYKTYAKYFVKYIEGMRAAGITIDAVTVQNEPLNPKNTPSMVMFARQEDNFIKDALGPAFKKAHIRTKILIYDHNPDVTSYALSILKDPDASQYVDGSAWHLYGGEISALTAVHDAFPNKNIYFTEQSISDGRHHTNIDVSEPVSDVVIGATRNWSKNVLLWNLAADPENGPHTNGGCTSCTGAITLDGDNAMLNAAYYVIAQASKFVPPGSVRVDSNDVEQLANVAFRTPDGKIVLIVSNTGNFPTTFNVSYHGKAMTATLPPADVATYVW
ncbi:MAG TPA: glycoside hydrolase family 30 beta sandwich domain-containing protein [Acidobacteriaceae bacterium]|nr:glycoside hydrolase family 30 beta sandwich domain-containing protein [Acidobacteriaceae bacterium]